MLFRRLCFLALAFLELAAGLRVDRGRASSCTNTHASFCQPRFLTTRTGDDGYESTTSKLNPLNSGATCRRQFITSLITSSILLPSIVHRANADDDADATNGSTNLEFNEDGSIKGGSLVQTEAKELVVSFTMSDESPDNLQLNVDGENKGSTTTSGGSVKVSYKVPEKWKQKGEKRYVDTSSEGANRSACSKITVFKAAGRVPDDRLQKATRMGVAKALGVSGDLAVLKQADVIGGRKLDKDFAYEEHEYYEFDMAVAPKTCGSGSADNLELGIICPYEYIYLLSSTIWQSNLYVMVVESTKDEWQQANSELKRVRSSFMVQS